MKLALCLVLLVSPAFAGNIGFSASSNFCTGVPFSVVVPGALYTITMGGTATETGQDTWAFSGGSVDIFNTRTGKLIFEDPLGSGSGDTYFGFNGYGTLLPSGAVKGGSYQFAMGPDGDGYAFVTANVPEPSSFLMVAAGFLLCTIRTILPREN